jgi:hypothetical protein
MDEQAKVNKDIVTKFKTIDKVLENIDSKVTEVGSSNHQVLNMMFSELDGKPRFKEASNKIRFATPSLAWNFNKRLNRISLDRFIYPIFLCYLRPLVD